MGCGGIDVIENTKTIKNGDISEIDFIIEDQSKINVIQKEEIDKDIFKKIKSMSQNNICKSYLIRSIDSLEKLLYKKININNSNEESTQRLLNEVDILKTLDHPNIMSFKKAEILNVKNILCLY